jgi:NAD(P)-dependent dehydrogenase (short-subunit alcohol dehydrogenase family)
VVSEFESGGGRAISVQADVSVEADVVRLYATVDRELGPLSALVNNAGILELQTGSSRWMPRG